LNKNSGEGNPLKGKKTGARDTLGREQRGRIKGVVEHGNGETMTDDEEPEKWIYQGHLELNLMWGRNALKTVKRNRIINKKNRK